MEKRGRDWRPNETVSRGIWARLSAGCSYPHGGHVCCGLPHEVSPQDFGYGAAAGVRRVQLPETNVSAAGRKLEGSGRKVGGSCGSRISLTVSVVELKGMVSTVCGENLVKTQPLRVPPSVSWHCWSLAPVKPQTLRCCFAACSCGTKHQALHGSCPLGVAVNRRCLLLHIAATATSALRSGLFCLFSCCSHRPKLTGGVEQLQPPWCLPSSSTWWVRPGAGGSVPAA